MMTTLKILLVVKLLALAAVQAALDRGHDTHLSNEQRQYNKIHDESKIAKRSIQSINGNRKVYDVKGKKDMYNDDEGFGKKEQKGKKDTHILDDEDEGDDMPDEEEDEDEGNMPSNEVVFGACEDEEILWSGMDIECAFVEAPMDYTNPTGEKIQIAISRYQHTDEEDYRGILVLNPGGPGGAGLILSTLADLFDPIMAAKYDWIGYDMRGSGVSIPSLDCGYQYFYLGGPAYDALFADAWLENGRNFAQGCEQNHGDFLAHMSNANHARDVERIREALGSELLNFYGFSYGTLVAQFFATMYPERVGKFVLDSVSDANGGFYEDTFDTLYATETAADLFFEWTAQYDSFYGLGSDAASVKEKYQTILDDFLSENNVEGEFGPAEWTDVIPNDSEDWPNSAEVLSDFYFGRENRTTLTELYSDPEDYIQGNIEMAGFFAIACRDNIEGGFPSYTDAAIDFERASEVAPVTTYVFAYGITPPCFYWPVGPEEFFIANKNYNSEMLLLHIEFDANTPLPHAYSVRDRFRKSVLVQVPGEVGHAESHTYSQPCLKEFATQYLLDGTLPPRDPKRGVFDYLCEENFPPFPYFRRRAATEGDDNKRKELEELINKHIRGGRRPPFRRRM